MTTLELLLAGGGAIVGAVGSAFVSIYNAKQKDRRVDFSTLLKALNTENDDLRQQMKEMQSQITELQNTVLELKKQLMEKDVEIERLTNQIKDLSQ